MDLDSSRLFRAALTGIVLVACVWGLRTLDARRSRHGTQPASTTPPEMGTPAPDPTPASAPPTVDEKTLPFVALDNTCYYSSGEDLSKCTGSLSGAPAREYRLSATDKDVLEISLEPRSQDFDPSFALFTEDRHCIGGYDNQGPGQTETAELKDVEPGQYLLVVGGYGDDCGPYELTVRKEHDDIAQVVQTQKHEGPNGTVLRWSTFAEVDLSHFILYRIAGQDSERVAVLRAHGSPAGFAHYRVMDRTPQPDSTYEIEAVANDGRVEMVEVKT